MKILHKLQDFLQRFTQRFERSPDYARKFTSQEPPVPAVLRFLDGMGVDLETVGTIILRPVSMQPTKDPEFQMLDWVQGDLHGYENTYHLPRLVALTKVTLRLADHPDYSQRDHDDFRKRLKALLLDDHSGSIKIIIRQGNFQEIEKLIAEIDARTGPFALKATSESP